MNPIGFVLILLITPAPSEATNLLRGFKKPKSTTITNISNSDQDARDPEVTVLIAQHLLEEIRTIPTIRATE
jgi:hypothetical protein